MIEIKRFLIYLHLHEMMLALTIDPTSLQIAYNSFSNNTSDRFRKIFLFIRVLFTLKNSIYVKVFKILLC